MDIESIAAMLGSIGFNLSHDEILTMQGRHEAGVRAAKERFETWGEWKLITQRDERRPFNVWRNNEYLVGVTQVDTRDEYFGIVTYLLISRQDGEPIHSWLDLQQIKSTLGYEEQVALEVYPPDCNLFDTANCYHLWVLPDRGVGFPLDLKVLNQRRNDQMVLDKRRSESEPARSHKTQRQIMRERTGSSW